MLQADFFDSAVDAELTARPAQSLNVAGLVDRLTASCERPRYNFMLLSLIAEASAATGRAGPYIETGTERITVRDWLCDAMTPMGRREPRRRRMVTQIREELTAAGDLPDDEQEADTVVRAETLRRLRQSGRTNVSRAVSELVRAGLLRRHYQGDFVDHHNRGGQRHAVYTLTDETRRALTPSARSVDAQDGGKKRVLDHVQISS